jgi:hypothetical protein
VAWANTIHKQRKAITMDPTAIPRSIARLQYTAIRFPFTVLEERVVARHRGQAASVRLGLGLFLGSLDRFAGWLLADEQISGRGQALLRRTGYPAKAGAPETKAPVRPARGGQDRETGSAIAAGQDQEHRRQIGHEADEDEQVTTGNSRPAAGDARARHDARERAGERPGSSAGPPARASTIDVRFTLPAEVQAGTVALCGQFNNWSAQDIWLERGGDGSWQATVALEPGRSYRYRYLLDGERWENAWQADRYVPNSHGSTDSVVVVEPARQPRAAERTEQEFNEVGQAGRGRRGWRRGGAGLDDAAGATGAAGAAGACR